MNYWLMKSEPEVFGIDHLAKRPKQTEHWDGVRNYQVRNMIRDQMKPGDQAFFYHSSCKEPGITGVIQIKSDAYPDFSALDPENEHFDPKSSVDKPRWYMVDVQLVRKFSRTIGLTELKNIVSLANMPVLRRGNRLSITPVTSLEWKTILKLVDHPR